MTRKRKMIKFWVDIANTEQAWLADCLDVLRKQRKLSRTIREGVALVVTLRQGDLSVLDELFPFVRVAMQQHADVAASDQFNEMMRLVQDIHREQSRALPIGASISAPSTVVVEAAPAKTSSKTVAENFVSSMKGIASGFFD